jgi:hypothetical protein
VTLLANCTLGFYNVTVTYDRGQYTLIDSVLTDTWLSDGFAGPTFFGHYTMPLISNIEGIALKSGSLESTIALLRQEMARMALGSAASVAGSTVGTIDQRRTEQRLLGRYPKIPALSLIGILYLYALVAIVFYVSAVFVDTRASYVAECDEEAISVIEVAQIRLTQPDTVVAALLTPPKDGRDSVTRIACMSADDMLRVRRYASADRERGSLC